jgi:hypothetical protein
MKRRPLVLAIGADATADFDNPASIRRFNALAIFPDDQGAPSHQPRLTQQAGKVRMQLVLWSDK